MIQNWSVHSIPILQDNFVHVVHNGEIAWVIDPGEAGPVALWLSQQNLKVRGYLLTHHHGDHVDGVKALQDQFGGDSWGPEKNKGQLPWITHPIHQDSEIEVPGLRFMTLELPGHTLGHVAYWVPEQQWLFSGDVLFALGCGRLFEGTPTQMFQSLARIKALPDSTLVFCTHDYFPTNQKFALSENLNINGYKPQLPLLLGSEKKFNPFLISSSIDQFRDIRERRNRFVSK